MKYLALLTVVGGICLSSINTFALNNDECSKQMMAQNLSVVYPVLPSKAYESFAKEYVEGLQEFSRRKEVASFLKDRRDCAQKILDNQSGSQVNYNESELLAQLCHLTFLPNYSGLFGPRVMVSYAETVAKLVICAMKKNIGRHPAGLPLEDFEKEYSKPLKCVSEKEFLEQAEMYLCNEKKWRQMHVSESFTLAKMCLQLIEKQKAQETKLK